MHAQLQDIAAFIVKCAGCDGEYQHNVHVLLACMTTSWGSLGHSDLTLAHGS